MAYNTYKQEKSLALKKNTDADKSNPVTDYMPPKVCNLKVKTQKEFDVR